MANDFTQDGKFLYETTFTALNNSGISGKAILLVDEGSQTVTVDIQARGLEPGQTHIQHIHGFPDDTDSRSPTIAQDADGDGFVELAEGLATYGPIQLNLTMNPGNAVHDHGADHDHTDQAVFPTVGDDGVLSYRQVFAFDPASDTAQSIFDDILPLEAKEIVLHGLTTNAVQGAGTAGEVDGTAGFKAALPVASGEVTLIEGAADVLAATETLGIDYGEVVDWYAIGAQVQANYDATGQWFL
jgi:hypothetical protein